MAAGGISGFTTLSVLAHDWAALRRALLAGAGVWLVMRIVERACRGGMGGGDTRLHTVLALYTGWISWHTLGVGIFAGTLLLGATAAITCLCGHATGSDRIAAGPSLLAGAWVAILLSA
jgi:leader peptidase (prepilin peptidase)/N-methyltransferase